MHHQAPHPGRGSRRAYRQCDGTLFGVEVGQQWLNFRLRSIAVVHQRAPRSLVILAVAVAAMACTSWVAVSDNASGGVGSADGTKQTQLEFGEPRVVSSGFQP